MNFSCMREYRAEKSSIVQFLTTKIRVVAPAAYCQYRGQWWAHNHNVCGVGSE